jgi:hypothetical protein
MKKDNQQLLIYGGGLAILYFGIIRPILKKVGIQQSAQDIQQQQLINNTSITDNSSNPFSPLFWKKGGNGTQLLTVSYASSLAKRIYDAMGYFTDDEAAVISVFRLLKTKSQVSWLSDIFQKQYKTDLFNFLRKGKGLLPQAGLNDNELSEIITIVQKLPNYK